MISNSKKLEYQEIEISIKEQQHEWRPEKNRNKGGGGQYIKVVK